jgi:tetratricopeptide (TPR) repeat protein
MKAVTKFAAVLLGVILAAYGSVEVWLSRQSYDDPVARWFCAAWLCPGEFRDARTSALQQAGAHRHAIYALNEFQRAVLLDSASAYRWADLAEAEMNVRQVDSAKYCYQRALAAGPGNPAILLRAADFAFRTNDPEATVRSLSAILRNPELAAYYPAAFVIYRRMNLPISELLENALPANSTAALAFLQFWMDGNQVAEADATWKWMLERSLADEQAAGTYVTFLMRHHEEELAASEWKRFNGGSMPGYGVTNWIFNGGFEEAPKPGPLDWHGIAASRVDDVAHDGRWSLKLTNKNVYQETVVTPGRWRIRAYMKTSGAGLALGVYDAEPGIEQFGRLNIHTNALTGANDWTLVERTFVVGPETKVVRVEVMREGPAKSGSAWIDSVELSPVR